MRPLPTLLAALVLVLALPVPARAGTYVVRTCDNGSLSGWAAAPYRPLWSSCGEPGGALSGGLDGDAGEAQIWRFSAPPATDIAGFTAMRAYWLAAGVAFGSPVYALQTFGDGRRYSDVRANLSPSDVFAGPAIEAAGGLTGQRVLDVSVNCGGGGPCRRPAGWFRVYAARIELRDAGAPRILHLSGTLLDDDPLAGTRTLDYTAEDEGGGVRRAELLLDGRLAAAQVVDDNGGACVPDREGAFADVVPCRSRAANTLSLDTRLVPDGRHLVTLRVYDATGTNADAWSRTIRVANEPPAPPPPGGDLRPAAPAAPVAAPPGPDCSSPPVASARVRAWIPAAGRRVASATVRLGRPLTVRGSVTGADGRPAGGELLALCMRIAGARWRAAGIARTALDGRFTASLPAGPSRQVIAVAACGRSPEIAVRVRAAARLRLIRHGRWTSVAGALRGGHVPRRGALVTVQVLDRHRWIALTTLRTNAAGAFTGRVAIAPGAQLRVAVPRQPGYPFAAGASPPR